MRQLEGILAEIRGAFSIGMHSNIFSLTSLSFNFNEYCKQLVNSNLTIRAFKYYSFLIQSIIESIVIFSSISIGLKTVSLFMLNMISPSVVAQAKLLPSGENLTFFTLIASFTFLQTFFQLLGAFVPGRFSYLSLPKSQASSSRSDSTSNSCSPTPTSPLIFFEFRIQRTPSRDRFQVTTNLLSKSLCLMS